MSEFIKINTADNVAVAINDVESGSVFEVDGQSVVTQSAIPSGHKVALTNLCKGDNVIKYGYPIGHLLADVPQGGLVDHTVLRTSGVLIYTGADRNSSCPDQGLLQRLPQIKWHRRYPK